MRYFELLNESQARIDFIFKKYHDKLFKMVDMFVAPKPSDEEVEQFFNSIIEHDPTHNNKFSEWLVSRVVTYRIAVEDLPEVQEQLEMFNALAKANRIQNKDINSVNGRTELYQLVKPFIGGELPMNADDEKRRHFLRKDQTNVVHYTPDFYIVSPLTYESERYWGGKTNWCTVARKDMFDKYIARGPLYIVGEGSRRWQISFAAGEVRTEDDAWADFSQIPVLVWQMASQDDLWEMMKIMLKNDLSHDTKYKDAAIISKFILSLDPVKDTPITVCKMWLLKFLDEKFFKEAKAKLKILETRNLFDLIALLHFSSQEIKKNNACFDEIKKIIISRKFKQDIILFYLRHNTWISKNYTDEIFSKFISDLEINDTISYHNLLSIIENCADYGSEDDLAVLTEKLPKNLPQNIILDTQQNISHGTIRWANSQMAKNANKIKPIISENDFEVYHYTSNDISNFLGDTASGLGGDKFFLSGDVLKHINYYIMDSKFTKIDLYVMPDKSGDFNNALAVVLDLGEEDMDYGREKELLFYNSGGGRITNFHMYAPKDKFEVPDGLYYQSHKYSAKIGNFIRTVAKLEAK